jgi:phage terminase Nu1 subunit (DNA packaging protein)
MAKKRSEGGSGEWWLLTTRNVMELFGTSRQSITNWVDQGMPRINKDRFDARAIVQWRTRYELERSQTRLAGLKVEEQSARLKSAQAGLREMELARERENIILVDEHMRLMSEMVLSAKSHLRSLPSKLAPQLAHQDPQFVQKLISQEINEVLCDMAKRGTPPQSRLKRKNDTPIHGKAPKQ